MLYLHHSTSPFTSFTLQVRLPLLFKLSDSSHYLHTPPYWSPMKDFSLFLLKNSLAAKMKRGIRSFCSGVGSTSTLNQRKSGQDVSCMAAPPSHAGSYTEESNIAGSPLTLEQMLLQLDQEEAAARRAKLDDYGELHRRMSCVNNSDILRSARNALNQYPRFSLDGRDSIYRSTFRSLGPRTAGSERGRRSVCCSGLRGRPCMNGYEVDMERGPGLPPTVAGERVVWCKPGVVAKLMGLDEVPVPVGSGHGKRRSNTNPVTIRKQNLRRMGRLELERERLAFGLGMHGCKARKEVLASRSGYGHCVMNPVCGEPVNGGDEWRFRQAR